MLGFKKSGCALLRSVKIRMIRSCVVLRVGGLLRRGMSIFAIPPAAAIQTREGQGEAGGDGFRDRSGRRRFGNAIGGRYSRFAATSARGLVESLRQEPGDWQSAEPCGGCRSDFQKRKHHVVADIQSMSAIDLLRGATKADTGSEDFPHLGLVRF